MGWLTLDPSNKLACGTAACVSKMPQKSTAHRDTEALWPECCATSRHAWRMLCAAPHMAGALRHLAQREVRRAQLDSHDAVDHKAVVCILRPSGSFKGAVASPSWR